MDKGCAIQYPKDMCLICVELDKGKLTTREARRALGEMVSQLTPDHLKEVETRLDQAEAQVGGDPDAP